MLTPSRSRLSCSVLIRPVVAIAGDESALVLHQLREIRGFAAGRGAGVEHSFAGLGIE